MLDLDQLRKHLTALDKGDDAAQRQSIHLLKDLGQPEWTAAPPAVVNSAVASLKHQLANGAKPPLIHKEIATIFGNMAPRSKSAVPQLMQLLQDGVPDSVRETAAVALGKIGSDAREAVDRLIALSTGQNVLAVHAIRALSGIGCADHRVRTALTGLWQSPVQSKNSQTQIAIAICKLGIEAKGVLGFLTNNLVGGQDDALRKSAVEGLAWCGKNDLDVVPALLTATLSDKNDDVRLIAQAALDQLHVTPESAIRICAKQLEESTLAEAALRKSGPLAVPALIEAMGKSEPATRMKAARILGVLGESAVDAVPALTTALKDKDSEIRLAAAKGLWNVTKKAELVVPVLVHMLEEKRPADLEDSEGRRRFLQTIIEALWRIGPPAIAAVPALTTKAKDKNRLVSESALSAIKKIAPTTGK